MRRYSDSPARAARSFVTLSPRKSRDAVIPFAFRVRTAASASSSVSPATNRLANFFARPLLRTKRKTRGWLDRYSRVERSISRDRRAREQPSGLGFARSGNHRSEERRVGEEGGTR